MTQTDSFKGLKRSDAPDNDTLNEQPRFTGVRHEKSAPLQVYGFLRGQDGVTWLQSGKGAGVIINSKVNFTERRVEGRWGLNSYKDLGTCVSFIESKDEKKSTSIDERDKKDGSDGKLTKSE